jgi:hypothetical protein
MNAIAIATRAVLCGVLAIGITMATGCSSHDHSSDFQRFGSLTIPLLTTVGTNTYRLDAVFVISDAQGVVTTLTTSGDEPVLSTMLPPGSYSATIQSFTLSKKDDATGTFSPVTATVVASTEPFTVFNDSTTTVTFQFQTDGTAVSTGSGTVNIDFGVTETGAQCTVLGPGCPDGFWCAPPALTGAPLACIPAGTTPIGAACKSPLECVPPSTCHDFGAGPICTALCTPDEFGGPCATGGSCVEADPSYGLCTPGTACDPIGVDRVARTVQSGRFFLDFSNAVANNPEDLDVLRWAGAAQSGAAGDFGPNLTTSYAIDACSSGNVAFFGNSLIPPDVDRGGQVLVGAGSTGTWEQDGASIVIHSTSAGCTGSVPAAVDTRYTFREGIGADTIEVERTFDFGQAGFSQQVRPFVPRLDEANFDQVLHPDATGAMLITEAVSNCPYGCELSNWDGSWLAYYASSGSLAGLGMIMLRAPSALPAFLWIDYDSGFADTNSTSVVLSPRGGFPQQATERELLCFFNAQTWTSAQRASLTLPPGCTLDLACAAGGSGPPPDGHPHVVDVQIDPGTTITTCQTATLTASVSNPGGLPFTYGWAEYGNNRAPLIPNGNQAVFGPGLAGDYFLSAYLAEPLGVFATFPVPTIHVTLDPACPPVVPDLATISQLYCEGTCNWGGSEGDGCHQEDADNLCRLRTGDPNATAQSFRITTALPEPGFCCSPYPTGTNGCVDIGPQPGIPVDVDAISWSLLDSHGPGDVVTDVVCQP